MCSRSAKTVTSGIDVDVFKSVRALSAAWFPSSVGMFVYILVMSTAQRIGCVTGYQVIRVIRIFAKTYPFE